MNHKLAKILLALGIGLSLVSCAKKPEVTQVKKEEKIEIGEMTGVAQMNGYLLITKLIATRTFKLNCIHN